MARPDIEELVEKLVLEIIKGSDLEFVDVEFAKERDWFLRVFLDKQGGLELDDCQSVSEKLENKLDALDPIKESYYLEVSSPGLDRPLKKDRDFVRHVGDMVEVHTYAPFNGDKKFIGILNGLHEGDIQLDVDGDVVHIPKEKTSQVRLYLDF